MTYRWSEMGQYGRDKLANSASFAREGREWFGGELFALDRWMRPYGERSMNMY